MELPAYKIPDPLNVGRNVLQRAQIFLTRAGTIIASMMVLIWFLSTFPSPPAGAAGPARRDAARDRHGDAVTTVTYDLGGNGKSQILGTAGFIKLVQIDGGPVVGIHMVGSRVGEQIGEAQLIVNWEATPDDVATLIHAHPTQNEIGRAHV